MPKISVIVPVYNVEKYIERCARSLFEQTLEDIEYLFIDDCTQDRSIDILLQVLEEYPNRKQQVLIHHMERNSGQAIVRKWGMMNASGEYVIHCDSDDWVDNELYYLMYDKAISEQLDVVICDCNRTDGVSRRIISGGEETDCNKLINKMLHGRIWWSLCNKLFRRELFSTISYPTGAMGEDMCICLQLIIECKGIGYVHSNYNYYSNPNSIIQNNNPENVIYKFNELSGNISIIKVCFSKASIQKKFAKGLRYLEYNAMQVLVQGLYDKRVQKLWKTTYRDSFKSVLLDNDALLKERFRCLLILLGLYPFKKIRQ